MHARDMDYTLLQHYWSTQRIISNYIHYKLCGEITYPSLHLDDAAVGVLERYLISSYSFIGLH